VDVRWLGVLLTSSDLLQRDNQTKEGRQEQKQIEVSGRPRLTLSRYPPATAIALVRLPPPSRPSRPLRLRRVSLLIALTWISLTPFCALVRDFPALFQTADCGGW